MKKFYGGAIQVIITGGTTDSYFNPAKDGTDIGKKTHTP